LPSQLHQPLIEIPGQATSRPAGNAASDVVVRVDACYKTFEARLDEASGGVTLQLALRADDGSVRKFEVLTLPPGSAAAADAEAAASFGMLATLVNAQLDTVREARRRCLLLHAPSLLPLSAGVRLRVVEKPLTTLASVFHEDCTARGMNPLGPQESVRAALTQAAADAPGNDVARDATEGELLKEAEAVVSSTALLRHMHGALPDANAFTHWRKLFAQQLGLQAFLGHVMAMAPPPPESVHFSLSTGAVVHLTDELALHGGRREDASGKDGRAGPKEPQGSTSSRNVPFRLTRNLQTVLGPFAVEGPYVASITASAEAMSHHKCPLVAWLELLERDSEVRWARPSGAAAPVDGEPPKREAVQRVAVLSPTTITDPATAGAAGMNLNHKVAELINTSTNPTHLGRMPPGWQAWL